MLSVVRLSLYLKTFIFLTSSPEPLRQSQTDLAQIIYWDSIMKAKALDLLNFPPFK
jgi:hypothetical protein